MDDTGIDDSEAAPAAAAAVLARVADRSIAQMSTENFPVALRLLPRRPRSHLASVYQYARFVDDIGDEAPGDRLAMLDRIASDVRALPTGGATLPPVTALAEVIDECAVPIEPLLDLVQANRVDQQVSRYETFDDLLDYCRLSAAPVGRIVLHIAGAATEQNIGYSDAICAALQVLEHCQDVGEDARAGRAYLPAEDLRAAGVPDADLTAAATSPRLRRVIARQVDRADALFVTGRPLIGGLRGWARVAVAGYLAGGQATSAALHAAGFDVLAAPIRPRKARIIWCAARLMVRG
jgi:squalene synthase HpnC